MDWKLFKRSSDSTLKVKLLAMMCLEVGSLRHSYSINAAIMDVTVKCTMIILLDPLLVPTPGVEGGGNSVCALVGCSRN